MKTLQAFWRWVDNEKPNTRTVIQKSCGGKALTPLARTALDQAADVVWAMHRDSPVGYSVRTALDRHRDDLRDISLALLPALGKVVERRAMVTLTTGRAAMEPPLALQCSGCGLRYGREFPAEPSVATRSDGFVRCNDCQATVINAVRAWRETLLGGT